MQKLHARLVVGVLFLLSLAACALSGGPRAPAALVASPGPAVIVLAWQDNSQDEDGFVLYRKSAASEAELAEEDFSRLAQTEAEVSSYRDEAVEAGRYYLYRVTALRGELESAAATSEAVQPEPARTALTVEVIGDGSGTVTSEPPGIDCSSENRVCSANFEEGTRALLEAAPGENSAFAGWGEACEGIAPCDVLLDASKTVTATFERSHFVLKVQRGGAGEGRVVSTPSGIDCGSECQSVYPKGTRVSMEAIPAEGSIFEGWEGACSGNGQCLVDMNEDLEVTAIFTYPAPAIEYFRAVPEEILQRERSRLEWSVTGEGDISLSISPNVGDVSGEGSTSVRPSGSTTYTLVASSEFGSSDRTARVTVLPSALLIIEVIGAGRIESAQPLNVIDCTAEGGDCSELFSVGQDVVLEATEGAVAEWEGCASQGDSCSLDMERDEVVTVTFQ